MLKKTLLAFFVMMFGFGVMNAQRNAAPAVTQWEYLEISQAFTISGSEGPKEVRTYNYLTSGESFWGRKSLEWLKESGWEMVGAEASSNLYFKRRYIDGRTGKEIALLKRDFGDEKKIINNPGLADLDLIEAKQKLDEYNRSEELRLKTALEKIKGLSFTIVSVHSAAKKPGAPHMGADLVLDGTTLLLKSGNKYRSSEVDKLMEDAAKQIFADIPLLENEGMTTNTLQIAKNTQKPWLIGKYSGAYGITLRFSVVIVFDGKQNIVGQGWIPGRWPPPR